MADDDVTVYPAVHGRPGHECDHDAHARDADPNFRGPHVTKVTIACASIDGEWRAACSCGYLSELLPSRQAALVRAFLHRRRVDKAPRAQSDE